MYAYAGIKNFLDKQDFTFETLHGTCNTLKKFPKQISFQSPSASLSMGPSLAAKAVSIRPSRPRGTQRSEEQIFVSHVEAKGSEMENLLPLGQ